MNLVVGYEKVRVWARALKLPLRVFGSVIDWGSVFLLMVSELERLSREVEELRARVEALELRLVPAVDVPEEEAAEFTCGGDSMSGCSVRVGE